jgi:bacterial/archaeal transporter family protein
LSSATITGSLKVMPRVQDPAKRTLAAGRIDAQGEAMVESRSVTLLIEAPMTSSAASSAWFIWALLSAVFAALTAVFAKLGLAGVNSDMATLIRTVIIFGVLGAFVYATDKWTNPFALSSRTWLFLVLSGLATGASWTCYFRALKVGDASKVAPVDKLSLLLVVIIAVIFLGERPSVQEWVGILMVGAGVMVLAFK